MKRLAAFVVAGLIFAIIPATSHAAPAAGTVIGNQATATYNDSGGNARTTTSNLVQTTVTQVKSFTLAANGARTAAPGQTVYYPHTITNTGNGADTYTLNAPTSSSFGPGPHLSMAYYVDANGDGLPDNATPIASSGSVPAGADFRFVVAGTVPAGAASGSSATITVSASDTTPTTATNSDTTTVANSAVSVTKSFSPTNSSVAGPITVTLSYTNTGTAAATAVQITDSLPATLTYVAGSGRSSVTGGAILTDANDGVEQAGAFPPGIDFRSSLGAGATVIAVLPSVPAGASGNVSFQVNANPGIAPQAINNTARYQTASQPLVDTNTASFQVIQNAAVVANGSNNNSANGAGEAVLIASAPAGATINFNDYIWNRGNGTDTFDVAAAANTFPPGTSVILMQQDGSTPLINSGGAAAPDTGPVPGVGQACPAPFVTDTTVNPNVCGERVVVHVVLPSNAPAGSYSYTLRATSAFNNAVFDDVVDTLGAVSANTADVTNDRAAPPAGTAVAADGLGASGSTIVRTNPVTPAGAPLATRFRVWVTNTGFVSYDFNLSAVLAAASPAGVTPPTLPTGWSVAFRADASGASADCSVVGAVITATGALAPGAARLACAEVTVPALASGFALAGNYDFDFTATAATNATVTDTLRDRVTVNAVRSMTFTGSGAQQTFPGGSLVYTHTLTNLGNASDSAAFNAGCLANSRAAQGWTSAAYIDANANGTLDIGTDTLIACGASSVTLLPGEARAIFVRATAPVGATPADPADVTTLTATNAGPLPVTDSSTIIAGLAVAAEQQALGSAGCSNANPPAGAYSAGAIAASANTAPGSCLAYRVTVTNTSSSTITSVSLSDLIPANTAMHYACSGNASAAPSVTVGSIAGTTPADGSTGTVGATVGSLAASQSAVLYFCVQVNAGAPAGTALSDQASGTGTQSGNTATVASNTVVASVGTAAGTTSGGVLAASTHVFVHPGQVVRIGHTLTNTGSATDSFSLTATQLPNGYSFASFGIFPDANADGVPDSAVPVANPIVLNPGQVYHFVLQAVVPTGGLAGSDSVRISATSTGGALIAPVTDVMEPFPTEPADCATAAKFLSSDRGPSPSAILTVTINYFPCDKARAKLIISDPLPAGMHYVPGSGHWSGTGALALTDAIATDDRQGTAPRQVAYDFGQTAANTVTAVVYAIAAQANGSITFQVQLDSGLARNTAVTNTASYRYFDASGFAGYEQFAAASYRVTGNALFDLRAQHIPTATPGTTVVFTNVLTNRGDTADTYDVTLGASTFPAGTQVRLYKSDGTTALADTDGDGTPDTGLLAPGAAYSVVVKVDLPATLPPGAYKVSKTARSALVSTSAITVDDVLDSVALACNVTLDPDNQSLIGRGEHVTYTHYLTNRGNCQETVTARADFIGDSKSGWNSAAYLDNVAAGAGSIPGVLDPTDTRVEQGWSRVVQPGERLRVLVDVRAPGVAAVAAKAAAKQLVDSDITTLVLTGATVGPLTVHDTTLLDDQPIAQQPDNAIRNFTNSTYAIATPWGVVGRNLFLRADAAACNADPAAVESRTVVISSASGEREVAIAVETGPNTGVFLVPALPIRPPPVVAGDAILEGSPNEVFDIELQGCGQRIETVVTLMGAGSVVFDSRSNELLAGASVTLVGASGGHCNATAATLPDSAPSTVITGPDGRFAFSPPAGSYCMAVKPPNGYRFPSSVPYPQLPAGHNLDVNGPTSGGSYGTAFTVGADGLVVADVPLDVTAQDGLFVQKNASRQSAEIGDFVDYSVTVRNATGRALDRADVVLVDTLPQGFGFVAGTARRDGARIDATASSSGLSIQLGHLGASQEATVTYRVRVGPGALQGDGVNRVQASYAIAGATTLSNIGMAQVQVTGGAFTDQGFVLGKVFLDCNANGVQDVGEAGVPGVRLWMEDGTSSTTDGLGKFSFYGVSNRTHIVKVDAATVPRGATMEAISSRHLGDGNSRIVDLKAGELHRADFAIAGCPAAVVDEVARRAEALARRSDELALAATQLTTEARVIPDLKALPASGEVSATSPAGVPPAALPGAAAQASAPVVAPASAQRLHASKEDARKPEAPRALEELLPDADPALGFMGIADGATLPGSQAPVRVKGALGASFVLEVNGHAVDSRHVAKRSTLESKQIQAWEYLGVEFEPGDNVLTVIQRDSFGNERGRVSVKVVAPGPLARIAIELPQGEPPADGRAEIPIGIALLDARGLPVAARTPVTLDTSLGTWVAPASSLESGVELMVEGGHASMRLVAPAQPGEARIIAKAGKLREEVKLRFMPDLRQMVAAGVVEGIINFRGAGSRAIVAAGGQDNFEQDLTRLSRSSSDGRLEAGARAAFFLKGKILGDALLTAAYDSDKDTRERLFRDIQPDEFYPVYGDSAGRGYDAQSTGRLYVRVDKAKSYLLYGDFNTQLETNVRRLSGYSRSLTGLREHYDNGRVQADVFATRDSTSQRIDEIPANGTSGPYALSSAAGLVNSEKVEILTRDRNRPALVIATSPQARFYDYEMEPLTGRLVFKAPVPSVDANLNPISIRVTYEVDQGGPKFWVYGADAQVKVTDRVEVGASFAEDHNPSDPFHLRGGHALVRLGEQTTAVAEFARTDRPMTEGSGNAERFQVRHDGERLKAEAFMARTDTTFDNPGAYLSQGRGESGARMSLKIDEQTTLKAEALRTEDRLNHNARDGALVSLERSFANGMKLEVGLRYAREDAPAIPATPVSPGSVGTTPNEVTSVRTRLTGPVPMVKGATVYGEVEIDTQDVDRKVVAVGGDYTLPNKGRIYVRHEFISSLTGPYGLNEQQQQNTSVLGIDTEYMKDARLFSEYRIRDALSGGDAEAAIGLRNLWTLAPGWRLGTTLERVQALAGSTQNDNSAIALGLEYTGSPLWKGSARVELRQSTAQDSALQTLGFASKLTREWTLLARNALSVQRNKAGAAAGSVPEGGTTVGATILDGSAIGATSGGGEHVIERLQAGVAFRDADTDKMNALALFEHKAERDDTQPGIALRTTSEIVSAHGDYKLSRPFMITAHIAAKWTGQTSNGLATRYRAQLLAGRATWEFAPRWDVGFAASGLFGEPGSSRQQGLGIEVGYLIATNLWISAGYNVFGYHDDDLAAGDYTNKGAYVRLRYKFDEAILGATAEAKP